MKDSVHTYTKMNVATFWVIIITINVVVGTAVGVIRVSMDDVSQNQPAFVKLSQQAEKVHSDLSNRIDKTNSRVDDLEQKFTGLDKRFTEYKKEEQLFREPR